MTKYFSPFFSIAPAGQLFAQALSDPVPKVKLRRPEVPAAVDVLLQKALAQINSLLDKLNAAAGKKTDFRVVQD